MTPKEVVARYKDTVKLKTLANWRSQGMGPKFTKVGGKILYPIRALFEWETSRTLDRTAKCLVALAAAVVLAFMNWEFNEVDYIDDLIISEPHMTHPHVH